MSFNVALKMQTHEWKVLRAFYTMATVKKKCSHKKDLSQGPVTHTCHPKLGRRLRWKGWRFQASLGKVLVTPHLNRKKTA
jgi:hypothetical protein